jgi:hypothetical protein
MQDEAIHRASEKGPSSETIEGTQNQANQDSNRSFPKESGGHGNPSAATATPSQCLYKSLA